MQCAALAQGKVSNGKTWKKVLGALHIPVSLADGCSSLVRLGRTVLPGSLSFVGTALQNKFTTVPETKLPPLTLPFPVQNGRKTCWRTAEQPKSFAIPPVTRALRAPVTLGAPSPDNKGRRGGDSGTQLMVLQNTWISL